MKKKEFKLKGWSEYIMFETSLIGILNIPIMLGFYYNYFLTFCLINCFLSIKSYKEGLK